MQASGEYDRIVEENKGLLRAQDDAGASAGKVKVEESASGKCTSYLDWPNLNDPYSKQLGAKQLKTPIVWNRRLRGGVRPQRPETGAKRTPRAPKQPMPSRKAEPAAQPLSPALEIGINRGIHWSLREINVPAPGIRG